MQEQARELLERIRHFAMPEWFGGSGIDFLWQARVRMAPIMSARVVDSFEGGRALTAKLFGIIPVARSRGPEADMGEALRGLSELPWRPFAFCEAPGFAWEATAADKLRAIFDDGRTRATFEFEVDADGRVLGGTAASRPRVVGKSVVDTA
jgi:hypothetical protein